MSDGNPDRTPRQARSRDTERRLLAAARALLSEGGLEACQVPAVALRAGVSAGTLYRRFADKDALIVATFRALIAPPAASGQDGWLDCLAQQESLEAAIGLICRNFVGGLRSNGQLGAALHRFAERHADAAFREEVVASRQQKLQAIAETLTVFQGPAGRPVRQDDALFVLTAMTATLNGLLLRGANDALSLTDVEIIDRVSTLAYRYLVGTVSEGG